MEGLVLVLSITFSALLSVVIGFAAWFFSTKTPDKEKLSPYECGFDPIDQLGNPVSVKFFLIAILFLVFDLEVALLLPWSRTVGAIPLYNQGLVWVFILFLVWGLVYEWVAGGLDWE
uniref:NADH-ubiquinone oxidoreductase chain 3 n=1 Tax=Chironex fleckeri TaxID=45396 RepID=G9IT32_CHIFL|nr:NADH dehydrogenase subunit 3 [Chironex fleckeri]